MKYALCFIVSVMFATSVSAEWVQGHFRSNGHYVQPYYRTPADGIPQNNFSYRPSQPSTWGNQRPGYTGNTNEQNNYLERDEGNSLGDDDSNSLGNDEE